MEETNTQLTLDQPATYQLKIQGRLGEAWSEWFAGMTIRVESLESLGTVTTLSGTLADQSALFGLLSRIRDLGLPLLLVERIL